MAGPLTASAGEESWFRCLFGRDALRTAIDLLDDFPRLAHSTLIQLARLQGVRDNPRGEEEPGRILHEHRYAHDPYAALLRRHWDLPYYGAIDTTPMWINALVAYCDKLRDGSILRARSTNRQRRRVSLLESLLAALDWLQRRLDDPSGGGFLWARRSTPMGLANQVWEDSFDAYYFPDGRLVDPSCARAPVSVQAYTYDALIGAADLLEATFGHHPVVDVDQLRWRARELRARVFSAFWCPDLRTFAHALIFEPDGARRACVVASGPGHLLASQLLDGDDAAPFREQLAKRLMRAGSFGVRRSAYQVNHRGTLPRGLLSQWLNLALGHGSDC